MGFFSKPEEAAGALAQLSKERIKPAIEAKGWAYDVDSDGDIGAGWDTGVFWFLASGRDGEVLQIRGIWRGDLTGEQFGQAAALTNDWNMNTLWPKAYVRTNDKGVVNVFTEVSVDWEPGVTDEQIQQQLDCALATSHELFAKLAEEFPGVVPEASDD